MPHIKPAYFEGEYKALYELILKFITQYNRLPNATVLDVELKANIELTGSDRISVAKLISEIDIPESVDFDWLVDSTEKWCKDRAVYIAIMESISIIDGRSTDKGEGMIPEILSKALSVTFDTNVGHDYLASANARYDFYHKTEDKIKFDIDILNKITNGGVSRKTLNIILAGCVHPNTNVTIRTKKANQFSESRIVPIKHVNELLNEYDSVQITSPDGWVNILAFVDKGEWTEYVLKVNGKEIRCNENHLFETVVGWKSAKEIFLVQTALFNCTGMHYLCADNKYHAGIIVKTGNTIPIVDIQIGHKNQRYYSDEVSSHNTAVGKSLAMCHLAAAAMAQGRSVLYITMEMSEERIAERIDANLFNVDIKNIKDLSRNAFTNKVNTIAEKTHGKLIIKEYPTGSAHAGHFRALLLELKLKKNFTPDLIFIDYLNICASSRMKGLSGAVNSYALIKSIAEEFRGLAVEFNVPIWSATQVTRAGFCLDINTYVRTKEHGVKKLKDIVVGDLVQSNNGFNEVLNVFPRTKKKSYKITLESGETIICSVDHKFPTSKGEKSISSGLQVNDICLTTCLTCGTN